MALFDREYYRDEAPPPGLQASDRMMVTNLVILGKCSPSTWSTFFWAGSTG